MTIFIKMVIHATVKAMIANMIAAGAVVIGTPIAVITMTIIIAISRSS